MTRILLYRRGLNDPQIARADNVTVIAVKKWRKAQGLPPNAGPGGNNNPFGRKGKQ